MAEQLTLIVTVALFASLIKSILGEKGIGKTVNVVISVILLFCVASSVIKAVVYFGQNIAVPVINDESAHILDNEEDRATYRQWLARVTADEISSEVEESVKKHTGFEVEVECPWHLEGDDVVFDVLRVYTDASERYYSKIKNTIKLYYQLDSECVKK